MIPSLRPVERRALDTILGERIADIDAQTVAARQRQIDELRGILSASDAALGALGKTLASAERELRAASAKAETALANYQRAQAEILGEEMRRDLARSRIERELFDGADPRLREAIGRCRFMWTTAGDAVRSWLVPRDPFTAAPEGRESNAERVVLYRARCAEAVAELEAACLRALTTPEVDALLADVRARILDVAGPLGIAVPDLAAREAA